MSEALLGWHSLGTEFSCACGKRHALPIECCYIGDEAPKKLAAYAGEHLGHSGFIISDENTHPAGGEEVLNALSCVGKQTQHHLFNSDPIDATDTLGDTIAKKAQSHDFLVAIGSGSLSDIAKYAGDILDKPVLLYATAASMNGYTSAITALKVNGLKRTLPCKPALGVFADPAHCATAPQRMTAAGVADFLSKSSSSTDWRAAHLLHQVYYCDRPREFFSDTTEQILESAPKIGQGDPASIKVVLDALMLSGCSMVIAGSSAPASGGEHLISHYLDMKSALYGTAHDLHGTQVGVATIYCLELWEQILNLNPDEILIENLLESRTSNDQISQWIVEDWGEEVGEEVRNQWEQKSTDHLQFQQQIRSFVDKFPQLNEELVLDLLPNQTVARAIRDSGGPTEPQELTAPYHEYLNALQRARYIRNRFTVLDLADDLGLIQHP
jgi:glycerol-1-phosphate dehydrogenase [NAD(P)+]